MVIQDDLDLGIWPWCASRACRNSTNAALRWGQPDDSSGRCVATPPVPGRGGRQVDTRLFVMELADLRTLIVCIPVEMHRFIDMQDLHHLAIQILVLLLPVTPDLMRMEMCAASSVEMVPVARRPATGDPPAAACSRSYRSGLRFDDACALILGCSCDGDVFVRLLSGVGLPCQCP